MTPPLFQIGLAQIMDLGSKILKFFGRLRRPKKMEVFYYKSIDFIDFGGGHPDFQRGPSSFWRGHPVWEGGHPVFGGGYSVFRGGHADFEGIVQFLRAAGARKNRFLRAFLGGHGEFCCRRRPKNFTF